MPSADDARATTRAQATTSSAPRVTIRAVAEHAGVSRQTVSNALNSRAARPHGYRFLVFDAPYADDDAEIAAYTELLAGHDVDAFVVADSHAGDRRPTWLARHRAPFVVHGHPWGDPGAGHAWVDVDGALGITRAVDHLVAHGHRRIGFVGWPADGAGGDARRRGWRDAMATRGLDTAVELTSPADDVPSATNTVAPLLARPDAPTALVCASDALALGALAAVTDTGAAPGRDLALTGYDDSDLASLACPGLTSVRQPIRLVAQTLVEHVLDQLGVDLGRAPAPAGFVAPELVVRASSTAPAPPRPTGTRSTAAGHRLRPPTRL